MVTVFSNGPGDRGSTLGKVIPMTKKWYLIPPGLTLSIIRYGSRVKWSNHTKGVVPSSTPRCSNYRKGSLLVNLDYIFLEYISVLVRCHKLFNQMSINKQSLLKYTVFIYLFLGSLVYISSHKRFHCT